MLYLIPIMIGIVGLDQLTKWLAVTYLKGAPSFPLWKDVFHFTYAENTGMAFSLLSGENERWIFMLLSTVAIIGMLVYLFVTRPESRWMQVSLAMIVGGGIGNMIDRIFLGYVVDFFDFTLINFAIFNVADSFVCVGAGILIAYLIFDIVKEQREEKARKAAGAKATSPKTQEEKREDDEGLE